MRTTLKLGDWNAICDQCGRKGKASDMTKRWDGLMVHRDPAMGCFEHRHPQDFVRAKIDDMSVSWTRSEPTDVFIEVAELNCDLHEFQPMFPVPVSVDTTIIKRYHHGTVAIEDGVTLTVICNLEIR